MTVRRIVWTIAPVVILAFGLAQGTAFATTIGYWEFHEKAVGSTAFVADPINDSSGNSHNGTVGVDSIGYVAGAPGYDGIALRSQGTGVVTIPASSQFAFDGSFTLEAEIKTVNDTANAMIGATGGWYLRALPSGKLEGYVYDAGEAHSATPLSTALVNDDSWHHVALVYDRSAAKARLYVDYALDTEVGVSGSMGTVGGGDIYFLRNIGASGWFTNGTVDFIRLSDQALAPSQFVQTPEPSTLALLATGLLGLLAYAWRKRL